MPIDSRIVELRTLTLWRMSAGTPECAAGRLASDSVPPRLTASLKICSAFRNLNATFSFDIVGGQAARAGALFREQTAGWRVLFVVRKVMTLATLPFPCGCSVFLATG